MPDRLTPDKAISELIVLDAEAEKRSFEDVLAELLNRDVPPEIVTRLERLWETTKPIAGETIRIGKILVFNIVDFVKAHPNLSTGIALGAAVGGLVGLVPWIGPLLQPVAMAAGAVVGGGVGASLDQGSKPSSALGHAIILAREFFELLANILNAIWEGWGPDPQRA